MRKSFLKVNGPFLPLISPVPVTFTRFLASTFRKVWSTSTLKAFCRCSYIFGITAYLLMDKWFPLLLALKHAPKHSWGLRAEGWMIQSIEDYSLCNISNRINLRRGETSNWYIRFPVFFLLGDASCFHVFPKKGRLSLSAQGKKIMFSGKRSCAGAALFGKTIFSEGLRKISYFRVFFKKDHLSISV